MTQHRTPHMLFVSQKVIDIKTSLSLDGLAQVIGMLREYLHQYSFIPGDKFTGELKPLHLNEQGGVEFELVGSSLGSSTPDLQPAIRLVLPLGLVDYSGSVQVQDIFSSVKGTSIGDGGNVQNILLNTLVLTETLAPKYPEFDSGNLLITIATSSDPFLRLDSQTANKFRDRVNIYPLGLHDRFAIHLPYNQSGVRGILAITSEPKTTSSSLLSLLGSNAQFAKSFRSATCFVSTDPFFEIMPVYALAPYAYVIHASNAFRALVAISAYGTNALLTMTDREAGEVCKLMLARARGTELDQTEKPLFPSPLKVNLDGIEPDQLRVLDNSIDMLSRYNPFFRREEGTISFTCPISFGREGGLIVGMNRESTGCFTSVLSEEGEQRLVNEYQLPLSEQIQETGAGDSVAAVVALFNTVSPECIITPFMVGLEKEHQELRHIASTIFVSCLSRIVGNLLVRTQNTNLAYTPTDSLCRLIEDIAQESVELARYCLRVMPNPVFRIVDKWGIRIALWIHHHS